MNNLAVHVRSQRLFFVEADISDGLFVPLAPVLRTLGSIDAIVHFAAQTSVQRSISCPLSDARINHLGTLQVFEFARLHGVRKVVFISSAAIYGDAAPIPTTEDAPELPISPYGVHKLAGEYVMKYYARVRHPWRRASAIQRLRPAPRSRKPLLRRDIVVLQPGDRQIIL